MDNDYKELPCRNCGRVWKWAFDKKSEPHCPQGYGCTDERPTTREMFDQVMKRLDDIEIKLNRIPVVQPSYPTTPDPSYFGGLTVCSKCGVEWRGVMGYACSQSDCPVQLKVTSQTYNVSNSTRNFDIESLDPDQRSWYYDGYGTKRLKK